MVRGLLVKRLCNSVVGQLFVDKRDVWKRFAGNIVVGNRVFGNIVVGKMVICTSICH